MKKVEQLRKFWTPSGLAAPIPGTDQARLDYIEQSHSVRRDHKGRWWITLTINTELGGQKDLREAIDAAMKERPNSN